MGRGPALLGALLALALCSAPASVAANVNDDRVAARTACYKACLARDGWDPVCVWNPDFPEQTSHGGGESVWPNECTAQCMAQYAKYVEWGKLEVKHRVKLPKKCYKKVWEVYISLAETDEDCQSCAKPVEKQPAFKAIPEDQCALACYDRDGWNPMCVEDFNSDKKHAFGNGCAAQCSEEVVTPLYNFKYSKKLSKKCKRAFERDGEMPKSCTKCPKGKAQDDINIEQDRIVARTACYKACDSRDGWAPVCAWNPQYPKPTSHGGGTSVWPNECMMHCMEQYAKYAEWFHLEVKRELKDLPKECEDKRFNIYYIGANDPTASDSLRKKCTVC